MAQSVLVETLGAIWKEQVDTHPDLMSCAFEVDLNGERTITGSAMTNTDTLDLELRHSSSELVNEIVRIMKESSDAVSRDIVFHDRGTLESALQDALDHCSYDSLFDISSDWEETRRSQRRDYLKQCGLSSLPIQLLDEIELDEEIDGIEEEIARLQEQKLLLKSSSLLDDGNTSSTDSIEGSSSSSPSPSSSSTEEVDDFLPPPKTKTKTKTLKRKTLDNRTVDMKPKKSKKIYASPIDIELELSLTNSITNFEQSYRRKSSQQHKKKQKKEAFRVEQVLKIEPILHVDDDDEDIDILN